MDVGRPRKEGNKNLVAGLYRDKRTGRFYIRRHGKQVTLDVDNLQDAVGVFLEVQKTWIAEEQRGQVRRVARKLKFKSADPLFTEYALDYKLNKLNSAVRKDGKPFSQASIRDYGNIIYSKKNDGESSVENARDICIAGAEEFRIPISAVDDVTIRKYLSRWLSNPYIYNYRKAALSKILQQAVDEGVIRKNPITDVSRRPTPGRKVYIEDSAYCAITWQMEEWEARVFDLIYLVSHRPTDVLALTEANVKSKEIHFKAAKNEQAMIIEANQDLLDTLQWFRNWKAGQNLISPHFVVYPLTARRDMIGKPVSRNYASKLFSEAAVKAGFPRGKYQLRDLRKKGLTDEAVIAGTATNKGGHKTEQMKKLYVVVDLPIRVRNNLKQIRG